MKIKTVYLLEDEDPSLVFVEHAVNRLRAFTTSEDGERLKSLNRFLHREFEAHNLEDVTTLLLLLAKRAREKWSHVKPEDVSIGFFATGIMQAADNAEDVANQITELFSELKPL